MGAINNCCGEGSPYLEPTQWLATVSFRWLHSFREFHGDKELPYPTDPLLYANTHVYGYDLSFTYQATPRFSFTLEVPINDGDRTSYYEHDFVHKDTTRASGVGDLRLIGSAWLLDPATHHDGNISLGLGVKFPTGRDDAMDVFHRATGSVVKPVDPAIQPGDGGWGVVAELSAFQKLFANAFGYAQGIYLINPRDSNGVQQPTNGEDFFTLREYGYSYNSVPDQYLARAGAGYVVWPKYALSLTLGSRVEGVPQKDLIGDNHGWRTPGYAFYVEPGLTFAKGRYSFSVTGPVAFKRHADKNLTDIKVSNQFHVDAGGNAAFADYLVTTSFSVVF